MHAGLDAPGYTSSTSSGQIKSSITDRPLARDNIKRSVQFLPGSPSDIGPTKKRKLLPSSGILWHIVLNRHLLLDFESKLCSV